ncbi:MAG: tRNA (guanine-N(1)-)-methyltransferase [Microgenomates bacterium OLB22]|nr:MAG: tRNA (guanine-N(1)-)-methyltransferase [Microgenomates bacterium OLB22]
MKIAILTLFPDVVTTYLETSIMKRAADARNVVFEVIDYRDFATDVHKSVDDRPFGGGAGMVMTAPIVDKALRSVRQKTSHVIMTSAKGKPYIQNDALRLRDKQDLIILCGHYEGFDARIENWCDELISVGDFVVTGGELPALSIVDSIVRLLPGVLQKADAIENETFFIVAIDELLPLVGQSRDLALLKKQGKTHVRLVEYPHYTRPQTYNGASVPPILISGNHQEIQQWKLTKAFEETIRCRPDLLKIGYNTDDEGLD